MRILILLTLLLIGCQNQTETTEEVESKGYEDGVYWSTVHYYNPKTDYEATYTLEVGVENNEVTAIYFSDNSYLDEDHITAAQLSDNGFASVKGENGKVYDIKIE